MKTPARVDLLLPSRSLAEGIAEEFNRQDSLVVPATMPLMTIASTALDVTRGNTEICRERILAFFRTDTCCFFDDSELKEVQKATWDPLRDWLHSTHGIATEVFEGLQLHREQPGYMTLKGLLEALDFWDLTTLEICTSYAKSSIIALALLKGRLEVDEALKAALVEELHQRDHWGTVEGCHDIAEKETAMWFSACVTFNDLRKE